MKKHLKTFLVALVLVPAAFLFAACSGPIPTGDYVLTQFTYGENTFDVDGDAEDMIAQFEASGVEGAEALGVAIVAAFMMAGSFELSISGNEMVFKIDFSDWGELAPNPPIQEVKIKYSLDKNNKIILEDDGVDEAQMEQIEDFGSFTYKDGKLTLSTEQDGKTFGLVFTKK